jgi:23S rRNA pseudouridine2605 synthase
MLGAVGHPVSRLHRNRYAGLTLDGLAPGEWRELTSDEVKRLKEPLSG